MDLNNNPYVQTIKAHCDALKSLAWLGLVVGLLIASLVTTGCMSTDAVTGVKKHNAVSWLNPLNWGGADEPVPMTDKQFAQAQIAKQFEKFQWAALLLIIGGVVIMYWTKGATGFGKVLAVLGGGLSIFAVTMQRHAALVGFIAVICAVAMVAYMVWQFFQKDNEEDSTIRNEPAPIGSPSKM